MRDANLAVTIDVASRRYGLSSPERAAQLGYQVTSAEAPAGPPPRELTAAEILVLDGSVGEDGAPDPAEGAVPPPGVVLPEVDIEARTVEGVPVPPGGCHGEVQAALGEDQISGDDFRFINALGFEAWHKAETDPRVITVIDAWADCMANRGHRYEHPFEPVEEFITTPGSAPTAREVRVATDDVACKQEHDLIGVWYGVEVEYQEMLIQENFERLAELERNYDETVRRAAELLGVPVPQR